MLEELLAAGHSGAEYDAWLIRIGEGDQFGSGFVGVNPNSKIPAVMDYSEQRPRRVFESGAILLYLADKFGTFIPKDRTHRGAELAVLADGFNALCGRRLRAFLCLCSGERRSNTPSTGLQWS
jgi:GST-like protein